MSWPAEHNPNALLDVALQLAATRSLDELLPVVLRRLVELLGAERALFALFDDEGNIEEAVAHNLAWKRGTRPPISHGILAEVLQSREMRQIVNEDPSRSPNVYESVRQHGLRFLLAVPVVACERVAGVLYADSRAPVLAETMRRTETLRALAGIVGLAVENVLLLEEQRLRTVLVGKLVHDLKNPLLAVLLGAEVLRGSTGDDAGRALADSISHAGRRMRLYCDNALAFAGIQAPSADAAPERVDVGALLERHARMFLPIAGEHGVGLSTEVEPLLPKPVTWADRVELALDNLVFNAIKHAAQGSTVAVRARRRPDAGDDPAREPRRSAMAELFRKVPRAVPDETAAWVEFAVHNVGTPIDPDLLPRVFDEWVKGAEATRGVTSTGLGLAIVEQCARSLGGRVWVRSDAETGTTFAFTVPIAVARVTGRGDGGSAAPR